MINDWFASMKHERYLSSSLMTDSTPISNSVTLTFTSALSDQIKTSPFKASSRNRSALTICHLAFKRRYYEKQLVA